MRWASVLWCFGMLYEGSNSWKWTAYLEWHVYDSNFRVRIPKDHSSSPWGGPQHLPKSCQEQLDSRDPFTASRSIYSSWVLGMDHGCVGLQKRYPMNQTTEKQHKASTHTRSMDGEPSMTPAMLSSSQLSLEWIGKFTPSSN